MSVTFKAVITPSRKRADGTWPVSIRVYYNGAIRRLPTTLVAKQRDLSCSGAIKSPTLLDRAGSIIKQMRAAVSDLTPFDLDGRDVDWVVHHIRGKLRGEQFSLDFFQWGEEYALTKTPSTRRAYLSALSALERYLGKRSLDINDITRAMVLGFLDHVDKEPKMHFSYKTGEMQKTRKEKVEGASARHLMKLAAIFQAAKERFNDEDADLIVIPRSPFSTIHRTVPQSRGQRSVGEEVMQRIISAQVRTQAEREALDAFVVSFALMGANMADLYFAAPPTGGVWSYQRQKTRTRRPDGAPMQVTVPEELSEYIGRLQEGPSGWWLPSLHRIGGKDVCTAKVNAALRKWCKSEGIPEFTFYAARHTWATLARKWGVEKATVDECLAHKGDYDVTDIYLERNWDITDKANRTVLSHFRWPCQ